MLTKEQIEQCRSLLTALTVDNSNSNSQFKMTQPEWSNRVDALCNMAIGFLEADVSLSISAIPENRHDERIVNKPIEAKRTNEENHQSYSFDDWFNHWRFLL